MLKSHIKQKWHNFTFTISSNVRIYFFILCKCLCFWTIDWLKLATPRHYFGFCELVMATVHRFLAYTSVAGGWCWTPTPGILFLCTQTAMRSFPTSSTLQVKHHVHVTDPKPWHTNTRHTDTTTGLARLTNLIFQCLSSLSVALLTLLTSCL